MEAESAAFYTDPVFWVGIAFAMFVGLILWRRVPAMIAKALDERAAGIKRELEEAKALRDEAAALLADFKRKHAVAAKEAEAILAQAAGDAKLFARDAEKRLEGALARQARSAKEKIVQAEANAVKDVKGAAVEAAVKAAEAALGERLKAGQNKGLIDRAIAGLGKRLH
jgi:F-type H+-transporting ATPase subunit b